MIKLICPVCCNDDITYIDDERFDDWFKCENKECNNEFIFQESAWELYIK